VKRSKLIQISVMVFSGVLSTHVIADSPTYNTIKAGYLNVEGGDAGFEVEGSFEVNDSIYLKAEYATVTDENFFWGEDLELSFLNFGMGFHSSLSENTDFFTEIEYVKAEASFYGESESENGVEIGLGIRSMISSNFEMNASVNYIDLGGNEYSSGNDTYVEIGVMYTMVDNLGIYLDMESDFDDNSFSLGLRFSF